MVLDIALKTTFFKGLPKKIGKTNEMQNLQSNNFKGELENKLRRCNL